MAAPPRSTADPLYSSTRHYFWKPYMAYFAAFELAAYLDARWAPTGRCLDLGCRDGVFTRMLRELLPIDAEITGTDIGWGNLRRSETKDPVYRNVLVSEAERLPFDDETFDTVMANAVFYCLRPDASRAAREVHRVLRPGGTFACSVPTNTANVHYWIAEWFDGLGLARMSRRYRDRVDKRLRNASLLVPNEWEAVLSGAGLRIQRRVGYITAETSRRWSLYLEIPRVLSLLKYVRSSRVRAVVAAILHRNMVRSFREERAASQSEVGDYMLFVCEKSDVGRER